MRRIWIGLFAGVAVALTGGCGGGGPVEPPKVTPELEAKQKAEEQQATDEENEMYKQVGGAAPKKKAR